MHSRRIGYQHLVRSCGIALLVLCMSRYCAACGGTQRNVCLVGSSNCSPHIPPGPLSLEPDRNPENHLTRTVNHFDKLEVKSPGIPKFGGNPFLWKKHERTWQTLRPSEWEVLIGGGRPIPTSIIPRHETRQWAKNVRAFQNRAPSKVISTAGGRRETM